jgi:vanillate O-demethylase ferredoxin subunit
MASLLAARVARRWTEALDIDAFELEAHGPKPLAPFEAGAHIDVELAPGMIRQYSLCNDPAERHRYLIGVLRVRDSRGGSVAAHELLKPGVLVRISEPRNQFPLDARASHHLLLAGGIGVTPLLAMAHRLSSIGASFSLHYFARSRSRAAFLNRLLIEPLTHRAVLHFDEESERDRFDMRQCLMSQPAQTHAYVCGPAGFMRNIIALAAAAGWPATHVHHESFAQTIGFAGTQQSAFEIELARSGRVVAVEAGATALQALRAAGVSVDSSCESGVCGTCLTRVLRGTPMHFDTYLTEAERAAGNCFLPCCSRAPGGTRLTIDA